MTEINVTSPTGARALKNLSGVDAVAAMWDVIEKKLALAALPRPDDADARRAGMAGLKR